MKLFGGLSYIVGQEPVDKTRYIFAHADVTATFLMFHALIW